MSPGGQKSQNRTVPKWLTFVVVEFLFNLTEHNRKYAGEEQVECTDVKDGPDDCFKTDDILSRLKKFYAGNNSGEGCVFYEGNDFVAHRRDDAFDNLRQNNLKENLRLGHAKHLSCLILSLGNALDTASVNLREIAGVIDDKSNYYRRKSADARRFKYKSRTIKDKNYLKHQEPQMVLMLQLKL